MIEFKGVHKTYDNGTKALRDLNLHIDKGEFVFVVGSSGAGKSTFLKLMMREEVASAGDVFINDQSLSNMKKKEIPYLRRKMGIVFQDFRLINNMTVFENVAFAMRVIGAGQREVRKRVPYILGLVGLHNKSRCYPKELSGGEQQRVGLARALVNNPLLIIADEPTGNIDPELSYEIVELLTEINRRGTTVLMVTHQHELVRMFNHRLIEISNGTVISDRPRPLNDITFSEQAAASVMEKSDFNNQSEALEKNDKFGKILKHEIESASNSETDEERSKRIEKILMEEFLSSPKGGGAQ